MTKTKSSNIKINGYQKREIIIKNKSYYNNNNNEEIVKYRYQNKNSSIFNSIQKNYYIKRKIPSPKKRKLFNSSDKENGGFSKEKLSKKVFIRNTTTNLNNIEYSPLKKNRTSYKDLIQQKKKSLGINLNKREKKKIKNELFVNYNRKREEVEKEILLKDEIIKNEMNNDYINNKVGIDKRIFSIDLSKKEYITNYNLNNKKNLNKINFDHNINSISIIKIVISKYFILYDFRAHR